MTERLSQPCAAFDGFRLLASGPLIEVVPALKDATDGGAPGPILVFDDATGRVMDFDLRGGLADVVERLSDAPPQGEQREPPEAPAGFGRGRGRPRLGVVGREVTLLPRQWDWLAAQPGGASVTLRKLVDAAKRAGAPARQARAAQEAAYRFMSAIAGDLPGFEEATRALFAGDRGRFAEQVAGWPPDVRAYTERLAWGATPTAA